MVDRLNMRFVLDVVDRLDTIDGLDWRSVTDALNVNRERETGVKEISG